MPFLDNNTPQVELWKNNALNIYGASTNKSELVEVNWYGSIAANDEAANIFYLFSLHMFCTFYKKTWNQMVINYHLVTLFEMKYIHLLDSINHVSMWIHGKEKNLRLCQWGHLLFQILTLRFRPGKISYHCGITHVPQCNLKLQDKQFSDLRTVSMIG